MSDGPPTPSPSHSHSHSRSIAPPLASLTPINATPTVPSPRRKSAHPTFHFASGLLSGISSAVLLQPADLLKTRVQQSPSHTLLPVLRSILSGPHPARALWRGTIPSALRTGFGSALYFTSLNTLRQVVANYAALSSSAPTSSSYQPGARNARASTALPTLTPTQNLITGATARTLAGLLLMPMTVIKVRYESDLYAYKSIRGAARSILKSEGVKGFFAGFGATAIRDAPYAGLYVVFYEWGKTWLGGWTYKDVEGGGSGDARRGVDGKGGSGMGLAAGVNALSGVFAAGVATALTNPFDAVKTRLQLMPGRYGNMLRATAVMWREGGVRGFFDGLGLRMGRKACSSALAWTVYEELVRQAERRLLDDRGVM